MSGEFFRENGWTDHRAWIPDDLYGKVLDSVVFGCTDMSLIDETGRIGIVKREREPQAKLWSIGGRMMPGESPTECASRILSREARLSLPAERFHDIATYSTCWTTRSQEPTGNGCHGLIVHFAVLVTPEEISRIRLDEGEYEPGIRFHSEAEILSLVEREELHPIFRCIVQDLQRLPAYTSLLH